MNGRRWVKWALLGLGIGLILWGAIVGQAMDTLRKAIYICLECMGLGA